MIKNLKRLKAKFSNHPEAQIYQKYFELYGGWKAICNSPYLRAALLLTVILIPYWGQSEPAWWEDTLGVLPNIIGFSLGGYTILLSFNNQLFQKVLIDGKTEKDSPYIDVSSAFAHFLVVQFLSILTALMCKAFYVRPPKLFLEFLRVIHIQEDYFITFTQSTAWFIGFGIFVYALLCGLAATMRIFRLTRKFWEVAKAEFPRQSDS